MNLLCTYNLAGKSLFLQHVSVLYLVRNCVRSCASLFLPSFLNPYFLFYHDACPWSKYIIYTQNKGWTVFWQTLTGYSASPCAALNLIHFQCEHLDQLVLMLASLERQAKQVLSMFPWAFLFLAPPQSPSVLPAAANQASERASAATFRKRLHELRLKSMFPPFCVLSLWMTEEQADQVL